MSCCTIKKNKTNSASKEYDALNKHFDSVELEQHEKYQLLILRDKASTSKNIDWIVWLQIKIAADTANPNHSASNAENLSSVCKPILDWIEILKVPYEKKVSQVNLFGESEDDEVETMPERPTGEKGWDKYWKDSNKAKINYLKKNYTFLELFNINFYEYSNVDYRKKLPTMEEVRELYKQAITLGKDNAGRYEEFWFDTPRYLKDTPMSDFELRSRLKHAVRLHLVPYTRCFSASYDMSYTNHSREREETTDYKYFLDGERLSMSGWHDFDKQDLPNYVGVFDTEMLSWIREELNIEYVDAISDENILKENLKNYFSSLLWYGKDEYDFDNKIRTFKDWKQFKSHITAYLKEKDIKPNGGGSGYSIDGFDGDYSLDKKGSVIITQSIDDRLLMNRSIEALLENDYEEFIIHNIKGDDIYKLAFELLNGIHIKKSTQTSLFDFMELAA